AAKSRFASVGILTRRTSTWERERLYSLFRVITARSAGFCSSCRHPAINSSPAVRAQAVGKARLRDGNREVFAAEVSGIGIGAPYGISGGAARARRHGRKI